MHIYFEMLVLTSCHIPSNFYSVKSGGAVSPLPPPQVTLNLLTFTKKEGEKKDYLLTNVFHLLPHMNGFGKESPRRLRHPPAQSSVKQLQRYYSLSRLWWKQCHSYASMGNKGVHSFRSYSILCFLAESANSENRRRVNVHQDSWNIMSIGALFKN